MKKYKFRCPKCNVLVDEILEYASCISVTPITVDKDGKPAYGETDANENDGDHLYFACPECGEQFETRDISDFKIEQVQKRK